MEEKLILGDGKDCIFCKDPNKTGLNNNILVIGSPGSGKTVSILESRLIEASSTSLIVSVTKRKLVYKFWPLLKSRGYKVWDLNFVNPKDGNVGFDPLQIINSYSDITFLAKSIVMADPQKTSAYTTSDPYWDEAGISLLSAEIAYVLMTTKNPTFNSVLDFHRKLKFEESGEGIKTNCDKKFEALEMKDPSGVAVTAWKSFKQLPYRTASCVFSNLNTMMDTIYTPELKTLFDMKDQVDIEGLASSKAVLFITTSPVNTAVNNIISMFYAMTFKALFEYAEEQPNGELPMNVEVLADDFATGCPVHLFDQYISIFREKGLSCTILIQSEAQLTSIYGREKATTIINNCDTLVYLGSMDLETARDIAIRTDKAISDILYMPVGDEILFRRGQKPVFTKRYNIFQNESYMEVTRAYENRIRERMIG